MKQPVGQPTGQPAGPPARGVPGPWLVVAIVIVIGIAVSIGAYMLFRK